MKKIMKKIIDFVASDTAMYVALSAGISQLVISINMILCKLLG